MNSAARRHAPAVIVAVVITAPLLGFSLQGDERRSLYRAANKLGSDPLEALGQASYSAGSPTARGSLGPIGRVLESLYHAFAFEAAEAAGLAPHVVQGAVRAVMSALVAVLAAAMVSAVMRSAVAASPATALFPLVMGAVLVAGGAGGPLTLSPFTSIGGTALVLSLALLVARDADMQARPVRRSELAAVALLGAAAALTHGLVCVAPAVAGGLVAARAVAAGKSPRALLQVAAPRRWAALSAGSLAVAVVERSAAAGPCDGTACFEGSGLSLSGDAAGLVARRMLTGAPPAGWAHSADIGERAGLGFRVLDLASNSLLAVLVAVIAAVAFKQARSAVRGSGAGSSDRGMRAAAGLAAVGAAVVVAPAVLAGLTSRLQSERPAVGEAWTDTLLVQVGWSLIVVAAAAAAFAALRAAPLRRAAVAAVAVLLAVAVAMTLLANERLAYFDRRTPLAAVVSEISEFTVIVEAGDSANALRCGLIDTYTQTGPDPSEWAGGPQLRADLDKLMNQRHGWPFCDPGRLNDPDPS